jgi:CHAD domain-containing protein
MDGGGELAAPAAGSELPAELVATGAGAPLAAVRDALTGSFTIASGDIREVRRAYFDTFDARLRAAGLTLYAQDERLWLVRRDGAGEVLSGELAQDVSEPLYASTLAGGRLGAAMAPIVERRAVLHLADVVLQAQPLRVLDGLAKTVLRLELESPAGLPARLRLRSLRGYEHEQRQVATLLLQSSQFAPGAEPLVDSAVHAAGGKPAGMTPAVSVPMSPDEPAQLAVARVLEALTAVCDANLPGTRAALDNEFLHDFRVCLRRIRAVVRELRGVLPATAVPSLRADLRWLQVETGPVRDLDVYIDGFDELPGLLPAELRGELGPLAGLLDERRRDAREQMLTAFDSERAEQLWQRWRRLLAGLDGLPLDDRPDALTLAGVLCGRRIRKLHRRMVTMGKAIEPDSEPAAYHELRKQGKELRYLLELFGLPLFGDELVGPMVSALKGLQNVLGLHQDRVVQSEMLLEAAPEVAARAAGVGPQLAMGALMGRFETDAASARGQFRARFAEFASPSQRRIVREAFPK